MSYTGLTLAGALVYLEEGLSYDINTGTLIFGLPPGTLWMPFHEEPEE